ncbi:AAA family ATPase [Stenotrophomonas rhizophila]|uniref:AAA family ATPase n=1 Tax=Stenotrophomonas rhizophila TaxID=216778 RepID=UPI001E49E8D2|nr:MoxR family ATPase [Stenotrophomonas rhizophila]MCC7633222.1 MoxR family ATPase [Stenotrophomonas rhizophila]MCC7662115.1 MoxR family ATPase [Stenotrophomonas rhizophila]
MNTDSLDALLPKLQQLRDALGQAVVGQHAVVEQLLIGLLAGGHCLLEGAPGLGKTLLVRSLGQALELQFRRVQFTPDLMPSDILGTELLEEDHGTGHRHFRFQQGPVFTNLLLADELNRTPPKTQAALLEAMQERTVSYAGTTYALPAPFFVLATQNPIEQAGTYPLPEAQLDRFLLHVRVDYPSEQEERDILLQTTGSSSGTVPQVMHADDVLALQAAVRQVHVSDDVLSWITRLVRASRPGPDAPQAVNHWIKWGAGPRAGQSLVLAAKARALLQGRFATTREDVQALVAPVMRHRLLLSFAAEAEQKGADDVIAALLQAVPFPA